MLLSHVTFTIITTVRSLHEIHDLELCTISIQNKMKVCESEVDPKEMIPFHFIYTKLLPCEQTSRLITFTILILVDCLYSETLAVCYSKIKFLVRALYIFAGRRDALCSSVPTAGHLKQRCDSLIFQQAETSRQGEYDDPVHLSAATSSVTRCQIEVPCNKSVHPPSSWITCNLNFVTHVAFWNYVTVIHMN